MFVFDATLASFYVGISPHVSLHVKIRLAKNTTLQMTYNGKFKLLIRSYQAPMGLFMLNMCHVGGLQTESNHFFKILDV